LLVSNVNLQFLKLLCLSGKSFFLIFIHLFLEINHILLEHIKFLSGLISFINQVFDLRVSF
jgi:hypothetical protein